MSDEDRFENVGIAFALVAAAGASTGLGAAAVFFPTIVKLASRRVLAGSLGFSAGVMTYVSFIEIFGKAQSSFLDSGLDESRAYSYATVCFFSGVGVMMLLNALVASLLGRHSHKIETGEEHLTKKTNQQATRRDIDAEAERAAFNPPCCNKDPVNQLENVKKMASILGHEQNESVDFDPVQAKKGEEVELNFVKEVKDATVEARDEPSRKSTPDATVDPILKDPESEEKSRLVEMGLNTALAIGLHNFPEGLATFVATLDDPKVGSVLAVAIAIHNIPEGLCVALPIFYATGNRRNAFLWALLSGASEIVAALLGWAILAKSFTDNAYAVLFGLVAGMMVIISVRELLPTAHFYDPKDTVVTYSFIGGMTMMAFSLVLFQI